MASSLFNSHVSFDYLRDGAGLNRHYYINHVSLLAPDFGGFAFTLHIVGIDLARVFRLYNRSSTILVFDEEIWDITSLVLLNVYPRDSYSVPFHPFNDERIGVEFNHNPTLQIALVTLKVPRAFLWFLVSSMNANRHIEPPPR